MGLGRAYRLGDILKSSMVVPPLVRAQRDGTIFGGALDLSRDRLKIGGGLGWMKWLKNGVGKSFIFHAVSQTMSFLVKVLLVKLKCLYIQDTWISIMKKQIVTKMWRSKRWWCFSKLLAISITSLIYITFSDVCKTLKECKTEMQIEI